MHDLSFPDHFSPHREKIGLVNGLFRSRSLCQNIGGPVRLLCESDIIHGANGNQESWAIEAVCRRLGYTGLKPDHKKRKHLARLSGVLGMVRMC